MSAPLFSVVIPGRVAIKKNSKRILRTRDGRPFIASSSKALAWEKLAITHILRTVMAETLPSDRCIENPVSVHMIFNFKSRLHEPDIDNCLGAPLDVLQKSGVLQNDKQVVKVTAEKRFGFGESVTIQIFKFELTEQLGGHCG